MFSLGGDTLEDFLRRSQATALSERLLDHFFQSAECKQYAEKLLRCHVDKIFHIVQEAERTRASPSQLVCRMADVCADMLQSFCTAPIKEMPIDIRKVAVAVAEVCADKPAAVGAVSCAIFGMYVGDALFDVAQAMIDDDYTQEDCDVVEGQLYVCELIMRSVASLQLDPELEKLIDNRAQEYLVSAVIDKLGREVLQFVHRLSDPASYVVQLIDHHSASKENLSPSGECMSPRVKGGEEEHLAPEFVARLAALKQLTLFCYSHGILESSAASRVHDSECMSNPGSDGGFSDSPGSPPHRRRLEEAASDDTLDTRETRTSSAALIPSISVDITDDELPGGEDSNGAKGRVVSNINLARFLQLDAVPE